MANGESTGAAKALIDAWKNQRATAALEKFWNEKMSDDSEFSQAVAIEQALYDLERYESALRRIAAQPENAAQIAHETLAYKRPDWS